jgi:hypothetical protein
MYERKRLWPDLIYFSDICLEGLRKTRDLSQYRLSPSLGFNAGLTQLRLKCLQLGHDVRLIMIIIIIIPLKR